MRQRRDFTNEALAAALLTLLCLLGALAMLPVSLGTLRLWTDDPLRSFGALLPPAAIIFAVGRWRRLNWIHGGTAWGVVPIAAAVLVARTYGSALLIYSFGSVELAPLQSGLLYFAFGSGIALLLGGPRLWRSLLFPLCLLLCVNPVPHAFYRLDYPLQEMSALVARIFAHSIGLQPTGSQLQMMFAPRFGMVIVPGCNGLRGSATMVYLALFLGYARKDPWRRIALTMLGGLLLGYLLNLVRLCCLVVYYRLALAHPGWQGSGEAVDYWIGGTIFLLIAVLAGALLLRPAPASTVFPAADRSAFDLRPAPLPRRVNWRRVLFHPRWVTVLVLLLVAAIPEMPYALHTLRAPDDRITPADAIAQLPILLGQWHRAELWTEASYGQPVWQWAAYRNPDGRTVDVGLWLSPGRHYAIQSQRLNGSRPLTGAEFLAQSGDGMRMQLASFSLEDTAVGDSTAAVPTFFAETLCQQDGCAEKESGFRRTGWFFANATLAARERRLLPILYRVEEMPGTGENPAARQQLAKASIQSLAGTMPVQGIVRHLIGR